VREYFIGFALYPEEEEEEVCLRYPRIFHVVYKYKTHISKSVLTTSVRLLHPYFVFLLIIPHTGIITFYTSNNIRMTKMSRCSIYGRK